LLDKRPSAIAAALREGGLLPDLTGQKIVLVGLGYTASPQGPLDDRNRQFVVDLWKEIVIAAGGQDPVVVPAPNTSAAMVASPVVGVVDFPLGVINIFCEAISVLPGDGAVGFIPDQAEFKDPEAARAVLAEF